MRALVDVVRSNASKGMKKNECLFNCRLYVYELGAVLFGTSLSPSGKWRGTTEWRTTVFVWQSEVTYTDPPEWWILVGAIRQRAQQYSPLYGTRHGGIRFAMWSPHRLEGG